MQPPASIGLVVQTFSATQIHSLLLQQVSKSRKWTGVLCSWVSLHLFSSAEVFELSDANLWEVKGGRKRLCTWIQLESAARGRGAQQCHQHCANDAG